METQTEISELVKEYNTVSPGEAKRTEAITTFLNQFEGEALFNRKNFVGHITASGYIINTSNDSLLLLKHKTLDRWLQPGGHVDATDTSLVHAALREVLEETGIESDNLTLISNAIFDIDSHPIPENAQKMEPAHFHHDISFLFKCTKPERVVIDENESTDFKWVSFAELVSINSFKPIILKIPNFTAKAVNS